MEFIDFAVLPGTKEEKEFLATMAKRKSKEDSRSLKLSTITREVHRGTDSCIQCRTNTDPSKIPVHPNCTCNAATNDIEIGQIPGDDSHFKVISTRDQDTIYLSESDLPAALTFDPATTGVVDIEDLRFEDLARWAEKIQPYLEGTNAYLSVFSEDSTENIQQTTELVGEVTDDIQTLNEAVKTRRVWFGVAEAVAGL
jgi:hypothetical protein